MSNGFRFSTFDVPKIRHSGPTRACAILTATLCVAAIYLAMLVRGAMVEKIVAIDTLDAVGPKAPPLPNGTLRRNGTRTISKASKTSKTPKTSKAGHRGALVTRSRARVRKLRRALQTSDDAFLQMLKALYADADANATAATAATDAADAASKMLRDTLILATEHDAGPALR